MPTGEKIRHKVTHRHYALVILTTAVFPIDNLRYDNARPWKEADANMIQDSCAQIMIDKNDRPINAAPPATPHKIVIVSEGDSQPSWQLGRWARSGLRFETISPEEAHEIDRNRDSLPPRLQYPELAKV